MAHTRQIYDDHRDLYLEILKKAEKEADRALIQMITKKLQNALPHPKATQDGCKVFSFPVFTGRTINSETTEECFWKNGQFWQDLVQFMGFLAAGTSWLILFCRLCGKHMIG